ncbi:DUF2283 domain-containing protein [Nonomuraea sp. NPDC052129]|uniref:DUF2283 domain-containing protein n=1 Tax=Nonomuraea sp. NPDC052129 TaxID=3154651 RepID=UPI003422D898
MRTHIKHDQEADAAYIDLAPVIKSGEAVEQVIVARPPKGEVILDFDENGFLLGVEIIGAIDLLRPAALAETA